MYFPERFRLGNLATAALMAVTLAGCDQDTTELIDQINAAREGCTEEMLKAADEECVQMFEQYAEMGENAIESYIGGMKALDEALRRRGGIQFDTAGLGHAITPATLAPPTGIESDPTLPSGATLERSRFSEETGSEWERDDRGSRQSGGWSDVPVNRDQPVLRPPERGRDGGAPSWAEPPSRPRPETAGPTGPRRRGALRPPEERLRRPWLDGSGASDPYYPERERTGPRPRPDLEGDSGGWSGRQEPRPAPYPRE